MDSMYHLTVPANDPGLWFAAGGDATTRTTGMSGDETYITPMVDAAAPASRVGGPGVVGATEECAGGASHHGQGGQVEGESAMSRASATAYGSAKRDESLRKERQRKKQAGRL